MLAAMLERRNGFVESALRVLPAGGAAEPTQSESAYAVENLGAVDATAAMRARADSYLQVRDLPPGSRVRLRIVD